MKVQRSIVVSVCAILLTGCGTSATDPVSAATSVQQSPAQSVTGGAVPPALRTAIASTLKIDETRVVPGALFATDLGADELAMVELVMAYERTFKIDIPNADADRFKKVQDVIDYLRKRQALR